MLEAIDKYAGGVFNPDDVRILVAAFDDAWRSPPLKWSDLRYSLARLVEVNGKWAAHERVLRRSFLLFVLGLTVTRI